MKNTRHWGLVNKNLNLFASTVSYQRKWAWDAAERNTGLTKRQLQRQGYRVFELHISIAAPKKRKPKKANN